MLIGFNVMVFIFAILKFIAFSYGAAMNPDNGFLLSFLGFTLGDRVLRGIRQDDSPDSGIAQTTSVAPVRMLIWGMASGAGIGIAEGILYAGRYYNGVAGPGLYIVRFSSCVALHAIWSGSAAILMYHRRDLFTGLESCGRPVSSRPSSSSRFRPCCMACTTPVSRKR